MKNTTYLLFVAIEEEVRKCLKQLLTGSGQRSAIIKSIVESEEVKFYWIITQADFDVGDEETYKLLLHKIVELYVTVRGHLYASKRSISKPWPKEHNGLKLYVENCMTPITKHTYLVATYCIFFD